MYIQTNRTNSKISWVEIKDSSPLSCYPIDMSLYYTDSLYALDDTQVPYQIDTKEYNPIGIARYALMHWNSDLATNDEYHRHLFLAQANWFVAHERHISSDSVAEAELPMSGWPLSSSHPTIPTGDCWLSAQAQGTAISVLLRAYQLTQQEAFLEIAQHAVRTFKQDILDGGVCAPVGKEGIFFEDVAVYPAAHGLSGFIFALFGLYDYMAVTGDIHIEKRIRDSLTTMHSLLEEFDLGFWTCTDLLHRRLTSPAELALQAKLLAKVAQYSHCDHCARLASRWKSYLRKPTSRLRYLMTSRAASYRHKFLDQVRAVLFPASQEMGKTHVCIPLTGFPVMGGTRTVLNGLARVMADRWQLEYLTQHVGPNPDKLIIHPFGMAKTAPWQFPSVWLYALAGCQKLVSLMCHGAKYHVILPQDGVFTAAFAGVAGKLAGVRVVCIDHGNLTLLNSTLYRAERVQTLANKPWYRRLWGHLMFPLYWPSQYLLALIAARTVDHFLIPGISGDGVEEACRRIGIHQSCITRFNSMIDINRHVLPDPVSRATAREKKGIPADSIVVAMICRLAPEKGIDIALESISQAISGLPSELITRVRVIIAGDGPLRKQVEEDIARRGLSRICALWGEISREDVLSLLGMSDIFLYTSVRGACFSMAVLEAMASGCAVIAATSPLSNAPLLADNRGITVSPGDAKQTAEALAYLLNNVELCHQMGASARNYIAEQHNADRFRRDLLRLTSLKGHEVLR